MFSLKDNKLTTKIESYHKIKLRHDTVTPNYAKNYIFPEVHKKKGWKTDSQLLKQGIISHSDNSWSAPICIVPKKEDNSNEKKWRILLVILFTACVALVPLNFQSNQYFFLFRLK